MSEEMAVNDISSKEEIKVNSSQAVVDGSTKVEESTPETLAETSAKDCEGIPTADHEVKAEPKDEHEIEINQEEENQEVTSKVKVEDDEDIPMEDLLVPIDDKRGIKRRASTALSDIDESEEFKGFENSEKSSLEDYSKVVERLEAEVTAAVKSITPLRRVQAFSITSLEHRAIKISRQDPDGSRPSSASSSRSDSDSNGSTDSSMSTVSTGGSRGRRSTVEMSSPLLRVPLEHGWKRELVYRAATDPYSKRNADIYYYTPAGKKLRSSREISENLAGTGLNLDNFSFFKEPLGIDDPEKEIIRDAKVMRRGDSPVQAPVAPVEGKRTPKPKPPKGASPEPPAKLKVKSVGSRLINTASTPTAVTPKQVRKQQPQGAPATVAAAPATASAQASTPAPAATAPAAPAAPAAATVVDNNNSSAWKKFRPALPALQSRPPPPPAPPALSGPPRQLVQPCSMTCGRGIPSLACVACLCLYHPTCVGLTHVNRDNFYCKNCRKSSPPLEPPPLMHKSGFNTSQPAASPTIIQPNMPTAQPRRMIVPIPVPAKVARGDKRVLLRMKVAGGAPDGSRVWAVTKGPNSAPSTSMPPGPPALSAAKHPASPALSAVKPPAPLALSVAKPPAPPALSAAKPPAPPALSAAKPPAPPALSAAKPPAPPALSAAKPPAPPALSAARPPAPPAAKPPAPPAAPAAPNVRPNLPQSLAVINGRRFIVVPRSMVQPANI